VCLAKTGWFNLVLQFQQPIGKTAAIDPIFTVRLMVYTADPCPDKPAAIMKAR
jgi:hypothetical protein